MPNYYNLGPGSTRDDPEHSGEYADTPRRDLCNECGREAFEPVTIPDVGTFCCTQHAGDFLLRVHQRRAG